MVVAIMSNAREDFPFAQLIVAGFNLRALPGSERGCRSWSSGRSYGPGAPAEIVAGLEGTGREGVAAYAKGGPQQRHGGGGCGNEDGRSRGRIPARLKAHRPATRRSRQGKKDGRAGRKITPRDAKMTAREARMAPREERWRCGYEDACPGSQDGRAGRKMEARDAKNRAGEAKQPRGKLKTGTDAINGRGEAKGHAID